MAYTLPKLKRKMRNNAKTLEYQRDTDALVGGNILGLITYGMYMNPLTIYREYIQNAADSIALSQHPTAEKVDITLDLKQFRLTIRDNGPGLSHHQAKHALVHISRSGKNPNRDRGFRGIGRLAGLAFAKSVTFLTRASDTSPVTVVHWNGDRLRDGVNNKLSAEKTIAQSVKIERIDASGYPDHFFEVQIDGISRYAATSILNRDAVCAYLGEVCPLPFGDDFPYTTQIDKLFKKTKPLVLSVHLNGEDSPVNRPHENGLRYSGDRVNRFSEFEKIEIPAVDDGCAAIGWIAHSSYRGALQKALGVRGLRVRAGNFQVGSETVFDHLFSEARFNRWCVAEIHILEPRIVPNGRRDYFEPSPHLRNLENHLSAVCRSVERRCRLASQKRNQKRNFESFLEKLEAVYALANSGYLAAEAARQFIHMHLPEIDAFREKHEWPRDDQNRKNMRALDRLKENFHNFHPVPVKRSFAGVDSSDVPAYRKIFKILAEDSSSPQAAKETIETILRYKPN